MTNVTSGEIKKCLEAVGENMGILLQGKLLTDYEFGNVLHDYLQDNRIFMQKSIACKVKSPYVIITDMFTFKDKTEDLTDIFDIPQSAITAIDYSLGYKYVINCKNIAPCNINEDTWSPEKFIEDMIELGHYDDGDCIDIDEIIRVISRGLYYDDDDLMVAVEIEDSVLAIAVDTYIPDAKQRFSNILGINQTLLVEVSGPTSTVILIDAEKLYLLEKYEDIGVDAWLI